MTKYIVMVFAGACSYGILTTFAKLAYREGYSAAEITFSQAIVSMFALWLLASFRGSRGATDPYRSATAKDQSRFIRPTGTSVWWPLLLTGVAIGLTTLVYYLSVRYISASLAIVILMQFTWIGALLEWLCYKKKPGGVQVIIMVVIVGATIVASGFTNSRQMVVSVPGVLLALGAALLYAMYVVANSRTPKQISPFRKSAIIMTGSAVAIFAANAVPLLANNHFDLRLLKWALFFSLFGTVIPQVLFSKGMPHIGAGVSAIILTAELPVAVITAHVVLHEPVSAGQWAGIVVMLLAMASMNIRLRTRATCPKNDLSL